jgi:hypothetical protein
LCLDQVIAQAGRKFAAVAVLPNIRMPRRNGLLQRTKYPVIRQLGWSRAQQRRGEYQVNRQRR